MKTKILELIQAKIDWINAKRNLCKEGSKGWNYWSSVLLLMQDIKTEIENLEG